MLSDVNYFPRFLLITFSRSFDSSFQFCTTLRDTSPLAEICQSSLLSHKSTTGFHHAIAVTSLLQQQFHNGIQWKAFREPGWLPDCHLNWRENLKRQEKPSFQKQKSRLLNSVVYRWYLVTIGRRSSPQKNLAETLQARHGKEHLGKSNICYLLFNYAITVAKSNELKTCSILPDQQECKRISRKSFAPFTRICYELFRW